MGEITRRGFLGVLGVVPFIPFIGKFKSSVISRHVVDVTHSGSPEGYREYIAGPIMGVGDYTEITVNVSAANLNDIEIGELIAVGIRGEAEPSWRKSQGVPIGSVIHKRWKKGDSLPVMTVRTI